MLSPFSPALRPRTVALRAYRSPYNIRSFRPCRCYSTSTQPPDRSTTATQDNPTLAEEKVQDVHSSDVKQEARAEGLHSQVLPPEKDATPTIQMEPFDASSSERGNNHLEELKESLRGWTETAATTIRKHADHYTARTATTFAQLGRELNKVTGYGEIELLKRRVVEQGQYSIYYHIYFL